METTDCWCSRSGNQCHKFESGEITFKRRLTKLRETTTYNLLVILGTQVDLHPEMRQNLH